jgi:hypothetical protein
MFSCDILRKDLPVNDPNIIPINVAQISPIIRITFGCV